MAGILLAVFPVLFLFNTRLAWADLGLAIALLWMKRATAARRTGRSHAYDETY
jgi:hypothetical protein